MMFPALRRSSVVSNRGAISSGTSPPFGPRCPQRASNRTDNTSSGPLAMLTMYCPIAARPYFRRECVMAWNTASVRRASEDSEPSGDSRRSSASLRRAVRASLESSSQFGSFKASPTTRRCTSAFWRMSSVAR